VICLSLTAARALARISGLSRTHYSKAAISMFLLLAIILVLLWAGGFFVMHISSVFIHLLIIFAVISLVIHLISGRRA
jgi:hypothetical protein